MAINRPVIDVHTHVLPGIDDGARDVEESCRLLELAASQGVTAVIATPHSHKRCQPEKIGEKLQVLQAAVKVRQLGIALFLGQETFYHEELVDELKEGMALTLNGSRYVLVEFLQAVPYQTLFYGLRQLLLAGYIPVLAHMERYLCLRNKQNLYDVLDCGCKLQMNYESLCGNRFSQEVRWCRRQVMLGRIHLLATDMHRTDGRLPRIQKAMEWLDSHVDSGLISRMTYANPNCILENKKMD